MSLRSDNSFSPTLNLRLEGMADDEFSDDIVAAILVKEAKDTGSKYSAFGFGSADINRRNDRAPKANTRFLRNIIRETDSHNAALLSKEKAESRARLLALRRTSCRQDPREDERHQRKRRHGDERRRSRSRSRHREHRRERGSRRESCDDAEGRKKRRRHHKHFEMEDEVHSDRQYRIRDPGHESCNIEGAKRDRRDTRGSSRHDKSKRDRSRSRSHEISERTRRSHHQRKGILSGSRTRSHSDSEGQIHRRDAKTTQELEVRQRGENHTAYGHHNSQRQSLQPDSDPLEELLGPLHRPTSEVRVRGRGRFSSTNIDAHFKDDYNPSAEGKPDSDLDDWDDEVEAYRDRQKWKKQGADRLRAAGFTEEQIQKWERSGKGGEKSADDVRWSSRGESREWDRGKVFDDDGSVDLKPEWGRLKGS